MVQMQNGMDWVNLPMFRTVQLILIGFLFTGSLIAQASSSLFLQTENQAAFRVKLNGAEFISSPTGRVQIPVTAGEKELQISFDQQPGVVYQFQVSVTNDPSVFTLRQFLNNAWVLYNLANAAIVPGSPFLTQVKKIVVPDEDNMGDTFSPPPVFQYKGPDSIRKIFERISPDGTDQIFLLIHENRTDTVALFIPAMMPDKSTADLFQQQRNKRKWLSGKVGALFTHRFNSQYAPLFS
jgi:hypothetical protein